MAYDTELADRIRTRLEGTSGLTEKKMFGGIGWMVNGHMACGAHSSGEMMIRCSREDFPVFTAEEGADALKRGGKGMMGWVLIDAGVVADDGALDVWVGRGRAYAQSLPPKKK